MRNFFAIIALLSSSVMAPMTVSATTASARLELQAFEPDSLEKIVASQRGKPFLLIVWSLDCQYCQASLKTIAQEKIRRTDMNVVTISTDPLDDGQAAKLMKAKLTSLRMMKNGWAFGAASPEQLRYAIDPKWHGEMPRSYWFNARGERTPYSGVITKALIAEKFAAN